MQLSLEEIREAIEEFKPPDRVEEHNNHVYFFEEGYRQACDDLLDFFKEERK